MTGRADKGGKRRERQSWRLPRTALCCFGAAAVLMAFWAVGSGLASDAPSCILPPAGQVIPAAAPFRFAVAGDNRGNMSVFEEILDRIEADDASFIVHTGDIVQRCHPSQFRWVLHELGEERLAVPFCPVPGNHDIDRRAMSPDDRCDLYRRAFGPRRYWFSYANTLFVAFDDSAGRCSAEDLAWLDLTLARLRDRYQACFVYMHVPPRDPRPGRGHALQSDGQELVDILNGHNVTAVFAGHIHGYLEDSMAGLPIFITGGAGAELEEAADRHHYLLCTVERDGSFTVQKTDVDDQIHMDYPEYVLRVKLPHNIALAGCAGLLLVGLALAVRRRLARGSQVRVQGIQAVKTEAGPECAEKPNARP